MTAKAPIAKPETFTAVAPLALLEVAAGGAVVLVGGLEGGATVVEFGAADVPFPLEDEPGALAAPGISVPTGALPPTNHVVAAWPAAFGSTWKGIEHSPPDLLVQKRQY